MFQQKIAKSSKKTKLLNLHCFYMRYVFSFIVVALLLIFFQQVRIPAKKLIWTDKLVISQKLHINQYTACFDLEAKIEHKNYQQKFLSSKTRYYSTTSKHIWTNLYCGIFTPCKNRRGTEICKYGDYATIRKAVFSPCRDGPSRTEPHTSRQQINALLSNVSVDATIAQQRASCFSAVSVRGFIREIGIPKKSYLCGGGVEYLHRDPASRRRRRNGKSQIRDSKIWSRVPRDSDPRKTALARPSSIYKRQTRTLVREGAPQKTRP
jgi:hypothetical protein